jgi:glucan phosphoethanolaminetransferase (alkaline phosphatase superfamily)
LGGRGRQISEFKANLVYRVSSRTARATQRNPVSKTKQNKRKQKTKNKKQKTKKPVVVVGETTR